MGVDAVAAAGSESGVNSQQKAKSSRGSPLQHAQWISLVLGGVLVLALLAVAVAGLPPLKVTVDRLLACGS
jgi:hypothetical protein